MLKTLAVPFCLLLSLAPAWADPVAPVHNVILFIPDGLRAVMVNPKTAPTMADIKAMGVAFPNSHSLFPTFTTPNASAMATGHYLGDTGDFSNVIYTGFRVKAANGLMNPFLEDDPTLGEIDAHFKGDYLNGDTLLKAAREKGYSTAAIGKLGPTLIWDHTDRTGSPTIIVDDSTAPPDNLTGGIALSKEMLDALKASGVDTAGTPSRGDNGNHDPGTMVSNRVQQDYFTDVATKTVLPLFKNRHKPFFLVFWSRDPDGTQHNQGDSPDKLDPGINGPTSLDAIANADGDLARLRRTVKDLGLADTTDIIVSADHGFSTISKESKTSYGVDYGELSSGFVAVDLAKALSLPLFNPDEGLIGNDPKKPDVAVAANGGSDLVYIPSGDKALANKVVQILLGQDYVSGLFVDDSFGSIPGTLPLSAINLKGSAITPVPSIVVNFRSFVTNTQAHQDEDPLKWTALVADTALFQGQGQHGSFSRADTFNFTAAIGPDFKTSFVDPAPISNADVGQTIATILGLAPLSNGTLKGRPILEAMPGGTIPAFTAGILRSEPSANGLRTVLDYQTVGQTKYFDAGGFPGKTVGLKDK